MKIFENKLLMYILLALIAGGVVVGLFALSASSSDNLITVVRVKQPVSANEEITDAMLTEKTVGAYGIGKVITDRANVVGKYAAMPISPEDNLTPSKLRDDYGGLEIKEGQRLLTISASTAAAGGGGFVRSGSIVDVVAYETLEKEEVEQANNDNDNSDKEQQDTETSQTKYTTLKTVKTVAAGLTVYSVKNSALLETTELGSETNSDKLPSFVTLIVDGKQADALIKGEYSAKLHLLLKQ